MKFCKYCGKELDDNKKCSCNQTSKTSIKKYFPLIAAVIVGMLLIAVFCILPTSKTNPFKADIIHFVGVNTYGDIEIDIKSLIQKEIGESPDPFSEEGKAWRARYNELEKGVFYSAEPKYDLSNGDMVTISFEFEGEAATMFKSAKKIVKVSGLEELEEVDVFQYINVVFSGKNGDGSLDIVKISNDNFISDIYVGTDKKHYYGGLSNGDEVTIEVYSNVQIANKYKKAPKTKTKTFTVTGLEYTTDKSNVSVQNNNLTTKNETNTSTISKNNSTPKEPSTDKGTTNVTYNLNLTWGEAYVDNGDGTFQLTFIDGQVYTYVPHSTEEGKYSRKSNLPEAMGQTFEQIKMVWECQWCKYCGQSTKLCHRYIKDMNCYDCGEFCKRNTCHICGEN